MNEQTNSCTNDASSTLGNDEIHVWVLDNDKILTNQQTGLPLTITVNTTKISDANFKENCPAFIPLNFSNHATNNTSFSINATHAINKKDACILGLINPSHDNDFIGLRAFLNGHSLLNNSHNSNYKTQHIIHDISRAIQLIRWANEHQYCSRCSAPTQLHKASSEHALVCTSCNYIQYPRVQPCVIIAISRNNPTTGKPQVLLAHHHRHSNQSKTSNKTSNKIRYGLIAGFVEVGESIEHAVEREIAEEVNLTVNNVRYITSQPWPYPTNLMLGFVANYASGNADNIKVQDDELCHAKFFDLDDLPLIPPNGTIAYMLIEHLCHLNKLPSPISVWQN